MGKQDIDNNEPSVSRSDRTAGAGVGHSHAISKPSRRPDGNSIPTRQDGATSGASNRVNIPSRRNLGRDVEHDDRQKQMARDLSDLEEESDSSRNESKYK